MSNDERAALLSKYMDQLREKYPSTPDDKIRAKAEELVAKKLGPETPAKPPERVSAFAEVEMPAPEPEESCAPSAPPPPSTAPNASTTSKKPQITSLPDHARSLVGTGYGFLVFGIIVIFVGFAHTGQLSLVAQGAIQENTVKTISNGWWLGGIGFMIVGMVSYAGGRICMQIRDNSVRLSQVLLATTPDQSSSAD